MSTAFNLPTLSATSSISLPLSSQLELPQSPDDGEPRRSFDSTLGRHSPFARKSRQVWTENSSCAAAESDISPNRAPLTPEDKNKLTGIDRLRASFSRSLPEDDAIQNASSSSDTCDLSASDMQPILKAYHKADKDLSRKKHDITLLREQIARLKNELRKSEQEVEGYKSVVSSCSRCSACLHQQNHDGSKTTSTDDEAFEAVTSAEANAPQMPSAIQSSEAEIDPRPETDTQLDVPCLYTTEGNMSPERQLLRPSRGDVRSALDERAEETHSDHTLGRLFLGRCTSRISALCGRKDGGPPALVMSDSAVEV